MTEEERSHNPGLIQESMPSSGNRIVIISMLVLAFILVSAYFHLERGETIGYAHFAYIPIIFAGFWWGRRAILVALILGIDVIAFSLVSGSGGPAWAEVVRALSFLIVAFVIGELSTELLKTHRALREREERLRKTNASLRKFAKLRRAFLHIAIHDMKSPVSATIMLLHSLETLMGDEVTEKQKHLMDRMHSRLDEATSFLRDFQLFAQLEDPSQIRKQAVELDLNSLIDLEIEATRDLADQKYHVLDTDLDDGIPTVGGVERLIREVIHNLITNAIKYTPEGGHITVRSMTKGQSVISVEVEDNGIGISEENQKKLFREFVRIKDNAVNGQKVSGIGLGLSIVKRIIDMHGGRVYVISRPGSGSIFGFDLRAVPVDDGPLLRPARTVPAQQEPAEGFIPD
jgi:signal transduction histidine kinase